MCSVIKKKLYQKIKEVLGVLFFLCSLFLGTVFFQGWQTYRFHSLESQIIVIPAGASLQGISQLLKQKNLVASAFYCKWFVRLVASPLPLRAGEYYVPEGTGLVDLIDHLQKGEVLSYAITVPEGLTSAEIASLLSGEKKI